MVEAGTVLILGGTGEALALARALVAQDGLRVITSLAGRTRAPVRPAGEVLIGGFGGPEGLAARLRVERVDLVIDATHPYAAQMSQHASQACTATDLPLLRLSRRPWLETAGDQWLGAPDLAAARSRLIEQGAARVFLTTGIKDLETFAGLGSVWFLLRLIEAPTTTPPLEHHDLILARGPFEEAEETRLLRDHRIDLLISKNSGGPATYAKIAAARALGLPVVMIARPPLPPGEEAHDLEAARAWVAKHLS